MFFIRGWQTFPQDIQRMGVVNKSFKSWDRIENEWQTSLRFPIGFHSQISGRYRKEYYVYWVPYVHQNMKEPLYDPVKFENKGFRRIRGRKIGFVKPIRWQTKSTIGDEVLRLWSCISTFIKVVAKDPKAKTVFVQRSVYSISLYKTYQKKSFIGFLRYTYSR